MTIRINATLEFEQEFTTLNLWWNANRADAANHVENEVKRVIAQIQELPEIGVPYKRRGLKNVRWLQIRKTPYKLYYRYNQKQDEIVLMALWSAMRKHGPPIKSF